MSTTTEKEVEKVSEALKSMGKLDDNESIKIVSLDDTIKFNCKRCGRCCSNRDDIILNPYDIYKLAKGLNITPAEVIKKYCSIHCGVNSCLPVITLKSDERNLCHFLEFVPSEGKFRCSINNFKPGACITHPIGTMRAVDKNTGEMTNKQYIEVPSCSIHGTDVEVKIRDFIKPYLDNETCHDAGNLLMHEITRYVDSIKVVKGIANEDASEEYFTEKEYSILNEILPDKQARKYFANMFYRTYMTTMVSAAYTEMNTDKGFEEQVNDIKENIKNNCFKMIAVSNAIGLDIKAKGYEPIPKDKELLLKITEEMDKDYQKFLEELEGENDD